MHCESETKMTVLSIPKENQHNWCLFIPKVENTIFDRLSINEKKTIRLVCSDWRESIDDRSEIIFNVILSDKTADWVRKTNITKFETLKMEQLTESFNFELLDLILIASVYFGGNNSTRNFNQLLAYSKMRGIPEFKFGQNSMCLLDLLINMDTEQRTFPSVKSFSIEIGNSEVNQAVLPRIFPEDDDSKRYSSELFSFFKNLVTLIVPALENLSIIIALKINPNADLNSMSGIAAAKKAQILSRTLTKYSVEIPEQSGQNRLKNLRVELIETDTEINLTREFATLYSSLISKHCSTLESIYIKSGSLDFFESDLHKCMNLKKLILHSLPLSMIIRILEEEGRMIKLPVTLRSFKWIIGDVSKWIYPENFLFNLNGILQIMSEGIEKIVLVPHPSRRIHTIDWIPRSLLKIKKIVIANIDPEEGNILAEVCRNHARANAFYIKECKNGKIDFCIIAIA